MPEITRITFARPHGATTPVMVLEHTAPGATTSSVQIPLPELGLMTDFGLDELERRVQDGLESLRQLVETPSDPAAVLEAAEDDALARRLDRLSDAEEHALVIAGEPDAEPEPELDRDPFVEQAMDAITQAERERLAEILGDRAVILPINDSRTVAEWLRAGGTLEGL